MKEKYGNGTHTEYSYDPARRWLRTIKTQNKGGIQFQNMRYEFDPVGNVNGYENDCLDKAHGNYKTCQNYEYDGLYQLTRAIGETTYNPYKSPVPEYVSTYEQNFEFDSDGLGNMMKKVSSEKVSPKRTIGDNLNYTFNYEYDPAYAHRLKNVGNMYYLYDDNGNVICEQDGSFESNGDDTTYRKITEEAENVYSSAYGWGLWREEVGGKSNGRYRRTYSWNERNQLVCSQDSRYTTNYIYGQDGQRTNKYTSSSETLYFNKMWTLHTDSGNSIYGGQNAKNIYLGDTRIVTKLAGPTETTVHEEFYKQYYYHSDHLGSASLISDYKGDEYQRIEYTPYGETWVEKTENTGLAYLPYKFTGKEMDEETGLYYYGARYLDPKYSRWISTDPAVGEYLSKTSEGEGGIYNSVNLNLYHYAGNSPIQYTDPTGREDEVVIKNYVPQEPQRHVDSVSGSLIPSSNYTQKTANQNKEQKTCWGEATFVDGPGENSCYMQTGLYSISSELNNSPKNHHIYAQGELDILNADFSSSATDGGGGLGFSLNGLSVSGKVGYQSDKLLITIGGTAGLATGGELKFDRDKGEAVFDLAFILGIRFEVNWKREEK